jgi:hypothetical protein
MVWADNRTSTSNMCERFCAVAGRDAVRTWAQDGASADVSMAEGEPRTSARLSAFQPGPQGLAGRSVGRDAVVSVECALQGR